MRFTEDLNCRRAAFWLLRELLTYPAALAQKGLPAHPEFTMLKASHPALTQGDEQLYSLLFGDQTEGKSAADLPKMWQAEGVRFPEPLKLVSAYQDVEGALIHLPAALAYEADGKVYLFEKIDPTLPYRLSEFNSWQDLANHWKGNRFKEFGDYVKILVNDQDIALLDA